MKMRNGPKKEGCCPDCACEQGQPHKGGCDVERCPECGYQRLTCSCITELPDLPWTGVWPGRDEAAALGFYCRWGGATWIACDATEQGAMPDLNKLYNKAKWNKELRTWVL